MAHLPFSISDVETHQASSSLQTSLYLINRIMTLFMICVGSSMGELGMSVCRPPQMAECSGGIIVSSMKALRTH